MSVKNEYLDFKQENCLNPASFTDRVKLQAFLRNHLEEIWEENPSFTNSGLFKNHMTGLAIGFAYYDCAPSSFCKTRCYGLTVAGIYEYFMLRLGVLTSESLKSADPRFLRPLSAKVRTLECLKIGHWGDAVPAQVPVLAKVAETNPRTAFWWYTRKREVAVAVNRYDLKNFHAYLSLDPSTSYPSYNEYPWGFTYFCGDGQQHICHEDILNDPRLVAIFLLKKRGRIETPSNQRLLSHPKLCAEKSLELDKHRRENMICRTCVGRCNPSPKT